MESFDSINTVLFAKIEANAVFGSMLAVVRAVANTTDEEFAGVYAAATADEPCEVVKAALATPAKLRAAFGAIAASMQRTGGCPDTENRFTFNKFIEALSEELNFIELLTKAEIDAIVASMVRDWEKKYA